MICRTPRSRFATLALAGCVLASAGFLPAQDSQPADGATRLDVIATSPGDEVSLYIDVEQLSKTPLVQKILAGETSIEIPHNQIEAVKAMTGVNLLEDIDAIALGGSLADETSTVISVLGNWDQQRLASLLKFNESYLEGRNGPFKVYRWKDDGDNLAAFQDNRLIVFSKDEARLDSALSRIEGEATRSPDSPPVSLRLMNPSGDLAGLFNMAQTKDLLATLKPTDKGWTLSASLSPDPQSTQSPEGRIQLLNGLRALALMQNDNPMLKEIAGRIIVSPAENSQGIRLELSATDGELVKLIDHAKHTITVKPSPALQGTTPQFRVEADEIEILTPGEGGYAVRILDSKNPVVLREAVKTLRAEHGMIVNESTDGEGGLVVGKIPMTKEDAEALAVELRSQGFTNARVFELVPGQAPVVVKPVAPKPSKSNDRTVLELKVGPGEEIQVGDGLLLISKIGGENGIEYQFRDANLETRGVIRLNEATFLPNKASLTVKDIKASSSIQPGSAVLTVRY